MEREARQTTGSNSRACKESHTTEQLKKKKKKKPNSSSSHGVQQVPPNLKHFTMLPSVYRGIPGCFSTELGKAHWKSHWSLKVTYVPQILSYSPVQVIYFSSSPLLRFRHVSRLLIHTTESLPKRLSPCHPANPLIKQNPHSSAPPAISWRTPVVDLPPYVNHCHHMPSWNHEILPVFVSLMTLWLRSVWKLCDARDHLPTIINEAASSSSSESKQWICKASLLNKQVNHHIFAQPAFSNVLHSFLLDFYSHLQQ